MNSVVVLNNHIGLKMEKMFFHLRRHKLIRILLHYCVLYVQHKLFNCGCARMMEGQVSHDCNSPFLSVCWV